MSTTISPEVSVEQFIEFKVFVIFSEWVVQCLSHSQPAKNEEKSETSLWLIEIHSKLHQASRLNWFLPDCHEYWIIQINFFISRLPPDQPLLSYTSKYHLKNLKNIWWQRQLLTMLISEDNFGCDSSPRSPNVSVFVCLSVTLATTVL